MLLLFLNLNLSGLLIDLYSQVRTNTVVKYDWQNQYYIGNLIAIHRNGVYLAYVLKGWLLYLTIITDVIG